MERKPTSFRLSDDALRLLILTSEGMFMSKTDVVEKAIREYALRNHSKVIRLKKAIARLPMVSATGMLEMLDMAEILGEVKKEERKYMENCMEHGKLPVPGFKPTMTEVT